MFDMESNNPEEIANGIIEQIEIVDNSLTEKQVLNIANYVLSRMIYVTPMYTGNLNPKWELYNSARKYIEKKL